jgi:hypothetical protein
MAEVRSKRRYTLMKVLIGIDPHKVSVAVAVVDEATASSSSVLAFRRIAPA